MTPKDVVKALLAAGTTQEVVKLLLAHDAIVIDATVAEMTKSGWRRENPASAAVLREVVRDAQGRITAVLEQNVEINDPRSE